MTQPDGVSGESGASTPGEDPAEMALLLKRLAGAEGFDLAGIARPDPSAHSSFLHWWLGEGHHGQMEYLARTDALERRAHPASSMPRAGPEGADSLPGTLLVVGHSYFQADPEGVPEDPSRGVVARYARGRDYHKVVKKGLKGVHRGLEKALGRSVPARISVDTGPILERELGQRAGLGWFGRNTMLIHPRRGSYFFLGVLLLELEAEPDPPFEPDHCGSCRACLDACPTGALLGRNEGERRSWMPDAASRTSPSSTGGPFPGSSAPDGQSGLRVRYLPGGVSVQREVRRGGGRAGVCGAGAGGAAGGGGGPAGWFGSGEGQFRWILAGKRRSS
jgi:ferredoxin